MVVLSARTCVVFCILSIACVIGGCAGDSTVSVDTPLVEGTGGLQDNLVGAGMEDVATGGLDIAQDPMAGTGGMPGPTGGAVMAGTGGEEDVRGTGGHDIAMDTGGITTSGGMTSTGGDVITGGVTNSGGISSTGGVASTGGVNTSGGATGGSSSTRDPNGPCKDLNLFCFDPFDMFIFNPDCFTCNNGKGCQACVAFQAQ